MSSSTERPYYVNHSLILKDIFHAQEGDFCHYCEKAILCSSSVYTCNNESIDCAFVLHEHCKLPLTHMHPMHEHILNLVFIPRGPTSCSVCFKSMSDAYCCQQDCRFHICLKCAIPVHKDKSGLGPIRHWSHEHQLRLLQRYVNFECDGCNKVATDFPFVCDTCSFWIHQSCASLPHFSLFGIHHKHPLRISDSLPQVYRKFPQFCKICKLNIDPSRWLYYCASCRFFAHIHCALSKTQVRRHEEVYDPELIHLPAPDELLRNSIMQKCIKDNSPSFEFPEEYWIQNTRYIYSDEEPEPDDIDHWSHEHTIKKVKVESERLVTCGGCMKPILNSFDYGDVFYECNQCNYNLHKYCAKLTKKIDHRLLGLLEGFQSSFFLCNGCQDYSYGFRMEQIRSVKRVSLDVRCACLPVVIKHQAHHHSLTNQVTEFELFWKDPVICKGCRNVIHPHLERIFFGCRRCDFYIHRNCALKPGTMTHRWDPHPLRLVLSLEDDIDDHPHEFQCEFCSEEIDTNYWFYHCNICDLSFHIDDCITACSSDLRVRHSRDSSHN